MYFIRNPKYGEDYNDGWVFFSYNTESIISAGIALFTRFEALSDIPISHCGIITGERECIEAAHPGGVQVSDFVSKYIEPDDVVVFLCRPKGINSERAALMEARAREFLGKGYAFKGVASSALWNLVGLISFGWLRRTRNPLNSKEKLFCSELASEALIAGYPERPGCLKYHPTNIYPQTLFEDHEVFDNWKNGTWLKKKAAGRRICKVAPDFPVRGRQA